MEGILPLLLWGGLFFLMMRFGCGSHMFGHAHGGGQKHDHSGHDHSSHAEQPSKEREELVWTAPETDTDPVCGKEIRTAGARSSVHNGWVYYFCSRECRKAFETAPESYLNRNGRTATPSTPPLLDRHPDGGRSHV